MSQNVRRAPSAIAILTAVSALAAAVFAVRTGWPLRYYDENQYLELAARLAHAEGYSLFGQSSAYRPPAWPALLAPFVAIVGPSPLLLLVPVALLALSALFSGLIVIRITGSPWGAVAAPLTLLYPLNLYTASTLYPQAFATALILGIWLVIVQATESWRSGPQLRIWQAALVGLMAAGLALAVPSLVFTGVVVGAWAIWSQTRARWRTALAMAVGFGVPVLAWTIRNLVELHAFVPFSTSSGENLLYGNNPNATATSGVAVDVGSILTVGNSLDEVARDKYYQAQAWSWISQHPWDAIVLWFAKMANYFNPYNAPVTAGQSSTLQLVGGWVGFGLVVAAVVARLILRRTVPVWRSEWLFLALFVLNAPFMAVFFTRTRFRQPLDASLVTIGAVAVTIGLTLLFERRAARAAAPGRWVSVAPAAPAGKGGPT